MSRNKPGRVRIIGGRWRGRRLPVVDLPGLRPSGDRSRETLFNWLQADIRGARCVDLFAGTGVLGFEAASRGARRVVLVEQAARAVQAIEANLATLTAGDPPAPSVGDDGISVVRGDALRWLAACAPAGLDIAFVDPPFGSGLAERALALLADGDCLAPGGLVYLETARQATTDVAPEWRVVRDKALGEVRMRLLERPVEPSEPGHLG
ncbi:MAG: 16S rRNA (guanine(966)-N(2))-methyltransferase RsmD [Xanthomonadales bacterium]